MWWYKCFIDENIFAASASIENSTCECNEIPKMGVWLIFSSILKGPADVRMCWKYNTQDYINSLYNFKPRQMESYPNLLLYWRPVNLWFPRPCKVISIFELISVKGKICTILKINIPCGKKTNNLETGYRGKLKRNIFWNRNCHEYFSCRSIELLK